MYFSQGPSYISHLIIQPSLEDSVGQGWRLPDFDSGSGLLIEPAAINLEDIRRLLDSIEITSSDYPDRGRRLSNLGLRLGRRYERMGSIRDLDEAIRRCRESVKITSGDHPDRVRRLKDFCLTVCTSEHW